MTPRWVTVLGASVAVLACTVAAARIASAQPQPDAPAYLLAIDRSGSMLTKDHGRPRAEWMRERATAFLEGPCRGRLATDRGRDKVVLGRAGVSIGVVVRSIVSRVRGRCRR